MGCCGGRSCGGSDSSDGQGNVGSRTPQISGVAQKTSATPHSQAASLEESPKMPHFATADAAEGTNEISDSGLSGGVAIVCNAPYGNPDDSHCDGMGAGAWDPADRAASYCSSPTSTASDANKAPDTVATQRAEKEEEKEGSKLGEMPEEKEEEGKKAAVKEEKEGLQKQKLQKKEDMNNVKQTKIPDASATRSPPRELLARPEQGGPLQALPPPRRAPTSGTGVAAAKQPSAPITGAAVSKKAQVHPAAAPQKKGIFAKVRSAPAAVARGLRSIRSGNLKVRAPVAPRRPAVGGQHAKAQMLRHSPRPPVTAVPGPRKAVKPLRPVRPGEQICAPTTTARAPRPVLTALDAPPQGTLTRAPRDPTPPPPHSRPSVGSHHGSTSAEGTSPGHSPQSTPRCGAISPRCTTFCAPRRPRARRRAAHPAVTCST
eukprot:TRINITY_DN13478_c0_g3_i2.p1 TRINITY_DN13478_c0_g3~~TRINITY_DN13478_c0_g3_i2.p1  ORF type:complete len:431 (+),score=83.38 TRINITY_DN13478_c0_g3_i2:93-1385(+)